MFTLRTAPGGGPRFSLRVKLALCMVGVALLIQALLGVVVLYYQYTQIDSFFSTRLEARMSHILGEVEPKIDGLRDDDLARIVADRPRLSLFPQSVAAVYSPSGQVLASTVRPPPPASLERPVEGTGQTQLTAFRAKVPGLFGGANEVTPCRVAVRRLTGPSAKGAVVVLAVDDWQFAAVTRLMFGVFTAASIAGVVAWCVASWLIAGLALAPLRQLRRVAGSFSPEALESDVELHSTSTEVAALERELLDSRAKLRAALHAQDRFISNVSHELNTPIAVVLTEVQVLPTETLPPEAREFAQTVAEEMRRLARLVTSFVTLTRLRGGRPLSSGRRTLVNDVVMETLQQCNSTAMQRWVKLVPRLAEADPPLAVAGDADLLRVMLDNLVRNAIRFSPPNDQVVVTVARAGEDCRIAVRDCGCGVPESLIPSLFDRFNQESSGGQAPRGHGMGLAIAQGVAELHAGEISVHNLPEGGCEFIARLPLMAAGNGASQSRRFNGA